MIQGRRRAGTAIAASIYFLAVSALSTVVLSENRICPTTVVGIR